MGRVNSARCGNRGYGNLAPRGVVQIGVGGIERDARPYGCADAPLGLRGGRDVPEGVKQERVVAHNEIAAPACGLVDDGFRHVKAQQDP